MRKSLNSYRKLILAKIYYCKDERIAKKVRRKINSEFISDTLLLSQYNKESALNLSIHEGEFTQGESSVMDKNIFNLDYYQIIHKLILMFYNLVDLIIPLQQVHLHIWM